MARTVKKRSADIDLSKSTGGYSTPAVLRVGNMEPMNDPYVPKHAEPTLDELAAQYARMDEEMQLLRSQMEELRKRIVARCHEAGLKGFML